LTGILKKTQVMKRLYIIFVIMFFFCSIFEMFSDIANANKASAPNGFTGAPGETDCTTCHSGTVNSGSGNVSIDFNSGATSYALNNSYNVKVDVNDGTGATYGFSLVALDQNGSNVGTINVTNTSNTKTSSQNGKTYVTHKNAHTQVTNTWQFDWVAPSAGVGDVTFYVAGNASNGGNNNSGDKIYTSNKSINGPAVGVNMIEAGKGVDVYPSIFKNELNVKGINEIKCIVSVYEINGSLVYKNRIEGNKEKVLDLTNLNKGIYIVHIEDEKRRYSYKVYKTI
jgi:hypothetical protein